MSIFSALVFGAVQGLAEFLPISSSGHLALLSHLFGLQGQAIFTAVLLHVATLLSVCVVMRKQIWNLIKNPFSHKACKLYVASAITFVIVFLIKGTIEKSFENLAFLPWCFLATAALLMVSERHTSRLNENKPIDYKRAAIIGAVQGVAALPGISRSGSTICAAMFCGADKKEATDFSFLLSLPIIAASALYEGLKLVKEPVQNFAVMPNLLAFFTAFLTGIVAVKLMQAMMKKARMWWFSLYLAALAFALLLFL